MTIKNLDLGDTTASEILVVSDDGNTIESKTAAELGLTGGGGGASGTDIESPNASSKAEATNAGTLDITGDIKLLDAGSVITLQSPDATYNDVGVDNNGRLTLPAKIIPADVTDPIHGEQRIKDGVLETYIHDAWTYHAPTYYPNKPQHDEVSMWVNNMASLYWNVHTQLIHSLDGNAVKNYSTASLKVFRISAATYSGFWMRFQFAYPRRLLGIKMLSNTATASGDFTWDYEGSVDGITWYRLQKSQNLTGDHPYKLIDDHVVEHEFERDDTCYRFLRVRHTSGAMPNGAGAYQCLFNFKTLGRSDAEPTRLHFNLNDRLDWTIACSDLTLFDASKDDIDSLISDRGTATAYLMWRASTAVAAKTITWDMGDIPRRLNGIQVIQETTDTHGVWDLETYDGTTWTVAKDNFTLGGAKIWWDSFEPVTCFQWRLKGVSGTTGTNDYLYTIAAAETKSLFLAGDRTAIATLSVSDSAIWDPSFNNTSFILSSDNDSAVLKFAASAVAGEHIQVQFNRARIWCGIKLTQSHAVSHGVWQLQTSNDGSTWTDEGDTFTLGGATESIHAFVPTAHTAKLYMRLLGVSGTADNANTVRDLDFLYLPEYS